MTLTSDQKRILYSFAILIGASLLVYGPTITTFTMSIDNEFMDTFKQDIGLGRWGISFLKRTILADPYAGFITPLVFAVSLAASFYVVARLLALEGASLVLFGVLGISFPALFYQTDFYVQSDAVGIGIFMGAVSAWAYLTAETPSISLSKRWVLQTVAIATYVTTTATYQSLFLEPVGLWLLVQADRRAQGDKSSFAVPMVKVIIWAFISFILFKLLSIWFQYLFSVTPSDYFGSQIGWHPDNPVPDIWRNIRNLASLALGGNFYGNRLYLLATLACLTGTGMLVVKKRYLAAFLFPVLLFLPFALNFALSFSFPPRTYTFQGFTYAYFLFFALRLMTVRTRESWVALGVAGVSVWYGTHVLSSLVFADYMGWRADTLEAQSILSRLHSDIPGYRDGETPVYFFGETGRVNPWKPRGSDIYGNSFFHWDGGNNLRITHFMKSNMLANVRTVTLAQAQKVTPEIESHLSWPAPGSIFIRDGIVVVKLGSVEGSLSMLQR